MSKLVIFFWLFLLSIPVSAQQLKIVDLTCDYRTNPLGIDNVSPRLCWKLRSNQKNVVQIAYRILVSDHIESLKKGLGNVWDSKKIKSDQSIQIKYSGLKLSSAQKYYWRVEIWNNYGLVEKSEIASWQMGLLNEAAWKGAKWIAYDKIADSNINVLPIDGKKDNYKGNNILPILRKSFRVTKQVKSATMYISGLGQFELSFNGQKVGDHFLDPGWTKYDKEALYVAFDLTSKVKIGENAIGVMLGNGFYNIPPISGRYRKLKTAFGYPKMICRLAIEYSDGTSSNIISNPSWKTAPSPITFSSIYGGEDYNAKLEQNGWNLAGFEDKKWKSAIIVNGPKLNAQQAEPVKIFDNFSAKSVHKVSNGDWVYDFGQNASALVELKIRGKHGDTIRITPAELLKEDGSVTQKNIGGPSYFTYILKGDGVETWRPRFMYTGFRYLQVKGGIPLGKENPSNNALVEDLKSLHIRNAAKQAGTFSSSNELFNKTFDLINWAIKSNMVSVFTDCPHREKLGWLEELHLMGSSVRYNFDVAPLFKKALEDMKNSQTAEGLIPEIAPEYVKFEWGGDMFRDSPEWGSSSILMSWYLYQWYGDKEAMATYYPMMKGYINYLKTKAKNNILSQGLGDWYDLGPNAPGVSQLTPMGVTCTAIYYYDLKILEKIATQLGRKVDALAYSKLAIEVRKSFNEKFFNPKTKQYATGSQAANAMAVYMGLVSEGDKMAVIDNLVKDIKNKNNSLTAGDIGYRYVLRVLEDAGQSDVIFDMNSRSDVPGYGMQLAKGATALTESWAALPTVSNNHFMLGHLMEWFYSGVGGIQQEENSVAFKEIIIKPEVVGDLTSANTSYNSPYGEISTKWKKTAGNFVLEANVPANTKASVYLPGFPNATVKEENNASFTNAGLENGKTKIKIGSGYYKFNVQYK
ncbi:family 78 glycoside hydrolase catalytic domain [Pedobacter paludis]|uniref:alpha-L-rhamnosidase n=1 Tax=Pedobacter paludis TaxID=2203212 RepID=A0A317F767_9SPHI|nr:family 78 glycoside hydrolase catalytic domain [Pedobacter paludis]PWS33897.1 alpha-L-rhamnosidase [Pedobacter paludis]